MSDLISELIRNATNEEKDVLKQILQDIREIRLRHQANPPLSEIGKIIIKVKFTNVDFESNVYATKKNFKQ